MLLRAEELGGTLFICWFRMGGVRLCVTFPLPMASEQGTRHDF